MIGSSSGASARGKELATVWPEILAGIIFGEVLL